MCALAVSLDDLDMHAFAKLIAVLASTIGPTKHHILNLIPLSKTKQTLFLLKETSPATPNSSTKKDTSVAKRPLWVQGVLTSGMQLRAEQMLRSLVSY